MLPGQEPTPTEFELKYLLSPNRVPSAHALLRSACRVDASFPANVVVSVYFDTPHLDLYRQKVNGDLSKTKVRIRWYEQSQPPYYSRSTYLEVKNRRGLSRTKVRAATPYTGEELAGMALDDPRFDELLDLLPESLAHCRARLRPVIVVRYRRKRYYEPLSHSRISVDSQVSVGRVSSTYFEPLTLPAFGPSVLEVKNASGRLPARINGMLALGATQASFSKYSHCIDAADRRCYA